MLATVHREANVRPERLRRIVAGLGRSALPGRPSRPPADGGRRSPGRRSRLPPPLRVIEPLGYLDFAALASQAPVIATDSGGLQKEAYWYGVPCVTMRPSTEWVDTVEAGANVLVDDDPDRIAAALAESRDARAPPFALRRRPRLRAGRGRARRYDAALCIVTSPSSAPATSACRSPRSSRRPAGRCCSSTSIPDRVAQLNRGESYIEDVPSEKLSTLVEERGLRATTDYDELREADAILIALPTPLSRQREPDLSIVRAATEQIATRLRPGHLVVLESTTYPGTTRDEVLPILERGSGLTAGVDFHLAFSPERVDPGRVDHTTKTVPKVVGGIDEASTEAAAALYGGAIDTVHRVSTPEAAELTKLLENIFRSVNIALVNELAQLCDRMGIDIWEVVDAAATKPFGFMRFEPGPGLGGHCIPIDPFYLTWKAREYDFSTRFIELAGEVNQNMPYYCRSRVSQALNHGLGKSLSGSRILVLGVAYKADISDMRESPAVKLIELLQNAGAEVSYHDPHVPSFSEHGTELDLPAARSGGLRRSRDRHRALGIDYGSVVAEAQLVVDLRNALGRRGIGDEKVWKL